MRAGPLRDRLEVLESRTTKDAGGAAVVAVVPVATVYGRVEPLSARERVAHATISSRVTHRVTLRYFRGLSAKHQLRKVDTDGQLGRRTFEIVGVTNPDERHVEHVCDVVEVVA